MQQEKEATIETTVKGKTSFGFDQINKPTPIWVTWIFRTQFVLNKVFLLWLASQDIIDNAHTLKTILGVVAGIDGFIWGMGKFVGISKDQMDK